jgi:hypothetical protein
VSDVAAIDTDVTAVAAIDSDVTAVAGVASDIPTVATNVSNINDYANTYQGAKATAPTLRNNGGALLEGDMYFNTTSDTMFVYGSGGWVPAGSSVNGTSQRYKYVATSGQTSFSGTDASGNTLTYDAGFIDVYLNGVHLDPTDYTATTGTSIVLGSGTALNDELYIVAFGTFNVASFNGSGLDDNTVNISKLNATGTRSASTFLAGDNTFKTVAVTPTAVSDQANSSTGYFALPSGTTAQRPASPVNGMVRYNTSNSEYEVYQAGNWKAMTTQSAGLYSVEYLLVAGGGSGGGYVSGGGGAGGLLSGTSVVTALTAYGITVGAGAARSTLGNLGASGNNSVFNSLTAIGGGAGAIGGGGVGVATSGGSGGGGGSSVNTPTGGSGTAGQGFAGGNSGFSSGNYPSAGGGGAGAVGQSPAGAGSAGGNGGVGVNWQSLGTFYAGGGGAGASSSGGTGGSGGGGNGGEFNASTPGTDGGANTGGGGGGNGNGTYGGAGGSGISIIRYLGAQRGTGGTVTSAGGYTYHTFTSSGTYTA